jgi:hypothetical protein
MGHIISTAKTFASVPGLKIWMDGRYGKDIVSYSGNSAVIRWRSLSPLTQTFNSIFVPYSPVVDGNYVKFQNLVDPGITRSMALMDKVNYNFLHNNNFGIFGINRHIYTGGTSAGFLLNGSTGVSEVGALLRHNGANPSFQYRITDGSGVVAAQFTSSAVFPLNTVNSYGLVRRSISSANNIQWFKDQVLSSQTSITAAPTGQSTTGVVRIGLVDNNTVATLWQGLLLVYDWSGYSEAQINAFVTTVNALITAVKPNFT